MVGYFPQEHPIWLPAPQVGELISVSHRTVVQYAKEYGWETRKVGQSHSWYVNWRSVDKWIQDGGVDK